MRHIVKIGKNISDIQQINRLAVIRILLEEKVISRVEIAKKMVLKKATITNIVNEFLNMNIIRDVGLIEGKNGRSTNGLRLNVDDCRIIAARISRKYVEVAIYDFYGRIHDYNTTSINPHDPIEMTMDKIAEAINRSIEKTDTRFLLGIGVAVPGPYIRQGRNMAYVTGFSTLKTVNIEKELQDRISFPVLTEHDSNMAAFAEWKQVYKDKNSLEGSMVFLTIEYGIGAGVIINGKNFRGHLGTAGEVGLMHINFDGPMCDNSGSGTLEYYASNQAIKRYVREKILEYPETILTERSSIAEIYRAYEEGDKLAKYAVERAAWYLGCGIANIINVLNPEYVVVGDRVPLNEAFLEIVRSSARDMLFSDVMEGTKIVYPEIRENIILLGASQLVLEEAVNSFKIIDWLNKRLSPDAQLKERPLTEQ